MSSSDSSKNLPVVHHFYPIHPQTALQQQSAVYNLPDRPLVAPILPGSSQSLGDAYSNSNKKRKVQEVDPEVRSHSPGSLSQATKDMKHRRVEPLQEPLTICLGPRQQRRMPYVELPDHRSIDLTSYLPISLASPASQLLLGWGGHYIRGRSGSQTSFGESAFSVSSSKSSTISEYLDPKVSIRSGEQQERFSRKKAENHNKAKKLEVPEEDEASTCHQCRRKTTKEKMHCRRLRPDGNVCSFLFCNYCIEVRYDETFDPFHPTWHCPRCRGICNCSICLRKAGFGYILDGSMSEQFTGTQGRLSMPGQGKKRSGRMKKGGQDDEEKPRLSVRAWLARKGIALGTEEWIMERRRQGVRYVVGNSPPPSDVPSPYMEAQSNPTIAACTEYIEEGEEGHIDESSYVKPICKDDAITVMPSGSITLNHSDVPVESSAQEIVSDRELQLTDMQPDFGALPGVTATKTLDDTTAPLPPPGADASAIPNSSEDLPGLCSAVTYGMRLIIGKPFAKSTRKKKQTPKIKKSKVIKRKTQADMDVSDYDYDIPQRKTRLPAMRARGLKSTQDDEEEEEVIRGLSPLSDISCSPLRADEVSMPPPAEPVLVPTDYYAPSKLDGAIAGSSQAHFGHTYWSLNAVPSYDSGHEHSNGGGHGPSSSSLLMSTPLYSNNDHHPYPQFSMDDVSPMGPSAPEPTSVPQSRDSAHQSSSESTFLSNSHTPDDYLNPQVHSHAHNVNGFTAHDDLAAFTTLDEWDPYQNLEIDMSPSQVEGTHPVDIALHRRNQS